MALRHQYLDTENTGFERKVGDLQNAISTLLAVLASS